LLEFPIHNGNWLSYPTNSFILSMKSWVLKAVMAAFAIGANMAIAQAHELPTNRLSIVLRDNTHITLTYLIDYPAALHQALAPKRDIAEFVMMYAAMPAADFQKALANAQSKFSSATKIVLSNGEPLTIRNWRWPDPAKVQAQLQQRVMQSIVAANEHKHDAAQEIQADATTNHKIQNLYLSMPESFGAVMVVSYKPTQILVKPRTVSVPIKF
jgi:hypothetical protein